MDKMREAFERDHQLSLTRVQYIHTEGEFKIDCYRAINHLDYDANCIARTMNEEWTVWKRAWQAAQSAAVPELPDPTTDDLALFERVVGPYGYAGSFERNAIDLYANSQTHNCHNGWQHAMRYMREQQSVPVVGEVVAWRHIRKSNGEHELSYEAVDKHANLFDSTPLIVQPTTSITAAELDALRKDAERLDSGMIITGARDEFGEFYTIHHRGMNLRIAIDAAIAGEKK